MYAGVCGCMRVYSGVRGWRDGWVDGWMGEWMGEWRDGWIGRQAYPFKDIQCFRNSCKEIKCTGFQVENEAQDKDISEWNPT